MLNSTASLLPAISGVSCAFLSHEKASIIRDLSLLMLVNPAMTTIGKVKRLPLANQTADLLRQSIQAGSLTPGTRLVETEISKEMGVSRGILREALRLLEQENLVESFPNRGTYVISPSERDIQEIYSLRAILEAEAVRKATQRAEPNDVDQLQTILDELVAEARLGNKPRVIEKDLEFHQKIWKMTGHRRLRNVLEELKVQIIVYLIVNTNLYSDLAAGIADHELILDAIRNKDEAEAVKVMTEHLNQAAELVSIFIRQNKPDDPD